MSKKTTHNTHLLSAVILALILLNQKKNDVKLFLQFFDKYCKLKLINDQKINTTIDEMNERGSTIDGTVARQIHDIQCNCF